jgi:hypothetical protein
MRWLKLEDEMLVDSLRVLLSDEWGNVTIGTRDVDEYFDDYSQPVYPVYWAYIEKPCLMEPRITHDQWVTNLARSNQLT